MTPQGQLAGYLDRLAALGGVVSAAEAIVATPEAILFRHAAGYLVGGERLIAGSGARFDAASLTKPWIATLALVLDRGAAEGQVGGKGFRLGERLPGPAVVAGGERAASAQIATEELLRHRSGLPAWTPLALRLGRRLGDAGALREYLLSELLYGRTAPPTATAAAASTHGSSSLPFNESLSLLPGPTSATLYSDLGYLLWGLLTEERYGEALPVLLDERVCAPLGVESLGAMAVAGGVTGAVECRLDNGKEIELAAEQGLTLALQRSFLRGIPQDGNARALLAAGRCPAHAGLFVTADEMLALGREWLRPGRLLSSEQVASALAGGGEYALGWARWSVDGSSGTALSPSSFGHAGFTGGSLWIDPEPGRIHLLLAHRLSSALDFNPFRREFHRLATEL